MTSNLREVAEAIAEVIRTDAAVVESGKVTVCVEDKADVAFQIQNALGALGLCVVVAITGFDRRSQSGPIISGNARIELSVYEAPPLNSGEPRSGLTAQGLSERIASVLHYARFPGLVTGPLRFTNFSRDDVDEANIVRNTYEAETVLRG